MGYRQRKFLFKVSYAFFLTSWIIDLFLELNGTCKKATSFDLKAIFNLQSNPSNPTLFHSPFLFYCMYWKAITSSYHSVSIHQCSYHHHKFLLISADYSTSVIIIFILGMYSLPRILDQLYYNQYIEGRDVAGCY